MCGHRSLYSLFVLFLLWTVASARRFQETANISGVVVAAHVYDPDGYSVVTQIQGEKI